MAHIRPLDNQPLRFVAETPDTGLLTPDNRSPRASEGEHSEGMHSALLTLIERFELKALDVAILTVLRDLSGGASVSKAQLAAVYGVTERHVGSSLARLEKAGQIIKTPAQRSGRGRRSSTYSARYSGNRFPEIIELQKQETGNGLPETPIPVAPVPEMAASEAAQDARVDDNPYKGLSKSLPEKPESLPHNNHQTAAREAVAAVAAVDWRSRLDWIHATYPKAFNAAVGGTRHWSVLSNICHPVKGEPCDWDLDVVPAIVELAAQFEAKGQLMTTFELVRTVALRKRDARISGNPEPVNAPAAPVNGFHRNGRAAPVYHDAKPPSWMQDMLDEIQAEAAAAQ